jgi:hypothetical protein
MGRKRLKDTRSNQFRAELQRYVLSNQRLLGGKIPELEYFYARKRIFLAAHPSYGTRGSYLAMNRLLDAAMMDFRPRNRVTYTTKRGKPTDPVTLQDCVSASAFVADDPDDEGGYVDFFTEADDRVSKLLNLPIPSTAGELLSLKLYEHLQDLRAATKDTRSGKSSKAPIRDNKMIPRSVIAQVAMDLLEDCPTKGYPPGPHLTRLIRALLDREAGPLATRHNYSARYVAAEILALAPLESARSQKLSGYHQAPSRHG